MIHSADLCYDGWYTYCGFCTAFIYQDLDDGLDFLAENRLDIGRLPYRPIGRLPLQLAHFDSYGN